MSLRYKVTLSLLLVGILAIELLSNLVYGQVRRPSFAP
jgi:hypothetical protein